MNDKELKKLLNNAKVIAIVGLSSKPWRTSYRIASYLKQNGYTIIPVNPNENEVLGERAYSTLLEIPKEISIDIVNVFRRSEFLPEIARETVERGASFFWAQLGIWNEEAETILKEAGIPYIMDRCIFVEHQRLFYG